MNFIQDVSNYPFFLITISLLWFFHIIRRNLFFLYFWQLKEYRIDRFLEETIRRKSIIFSKFFFFGVTGLFFWFLFKAFGFFSGQILLVSVIVFLFFAYSIYLLFKKQWQFPKWTKKMIVFFGIVVFGEIGLIAFFWNKNFLLFILIFEIFLLFFIFFCMRIVQIPVTLTKQFIYYRAKKKIKKMSNLTVIGITGSYGKTTNKEILSQILSYKYKVLKTEANTNTCIGVANTILKKLNNNHEIFVCEIAAYRRGEVKQTAGIISPKIGILTGINEQHLSLFGSQENIIKGKYELIEALPQDGIAFFNAKNKHTKELYQKCKIKKFLYGEEAYFSGEENILGAKMVAKELGMTEEEIQKAIHMNENNVLGIEIRQGINESKIIDASYSANPNGVMAHLEYLKNLSGKKIIIMPCLIELGGTAEEIHRKIGEKIAEGCDLAIIVTNDFFENLKSGAIERGMNPENIIFLNSTDKIIEKIKQFIKPKDTILLEGRISEQLKVMLIQER